VNKEIDVDVNSKFPNEWILKNWWLSQKNPLQINGASL